MAQKVTTIQDVARVAGVSTATVSRALSAPQKVDQTTRNCVLEAISVTGYRANRAARSLRMQRSGAVLVLVPNLGNPFFSQILAGLTESFAGQDMSVLVLDTSHVAVNSSVLLDYFLDRRVDGMLSLDGSISLTTLANLSDNGVGNRVVSACEWVAGSDLPSVRSNNDKGAVLAVQHLFDLGHRRIAHVMGPEGNVLTEVRRAAVKKTCAALGIEQKPQWMIEGDFTLSAGHVAAAHIMALPMADRPTAVFCASDEMACGLIAGLSEQRVEVPKDISVVGFDDIEIAASFVPALTTIQQDRMALGRRAAERLMRLLKGTEPASSKIDLIDVSLVTRASTGPCKEGT